MASLKVIVVDDDTEFLEEIEEVLHSKGYSVEVVSDPFAAVEAIERSKPDAVLLDLRMKGKSGFEIAADVSACPETAGIPIIAMTAHFAEEEVEKLKESGVVRSFLTKPLSIPEVIAKLEEVLG